MLPLRAADVGRSAGQLDAVGCERQFIDHIAPVWRLLPDRGRFLTDASLLDYARAKGIDAEPIDANQLRQSSPPPKARPGDGPRAFVASIGDTKIARRLGYRRFAFIEHGAGQAYIGERGNGARNPSYAGGDDREDTELFLVPNEYSAALWRKAYPAARVAIVGCPKIDELPRKERNRAPVVAITFHWPAPLSISGYAGTALGDYLPVLPEIAKAFPGRVIGTAHPKGDWPDRMKRTYARAGIPFVRDFEDVCRVADVLVFDNTSVGFEFAATGRPVVVLNARYWSRKLSHGLRFWDAAHVGINVDRPEQLVPAIHEALADSPEHQQDREEALQLVYQPRTNGAAYAVTALSDWLAPASPRQEITPAMAAYYAEEDAGRRE